MRPQLCMWLKMCLILKTKGENLDYKALKFPTQESNVHSAFRVPHCGMRKLKIHIVLLLACNFRFPCSSAKRGTQKSICLIFFILFLDFRFPLYGMEKSELFFPQCFFIRFPFSALRKVGCRTSICF